MHDSDFEGVAIAWRVWTAADVSERAMRRLGALHLLVYLVSSGFSHSQDSARQAAATDVADVTYTPPTSDRSPPCAVRR